MRQCRRVAQHGATTQPNYKAIRAALIRQIIKLAERSCPDRACDMFHIAAATIHSPDDELFAQGGLPVSSPHESSPLSLRCGAKSNGSYFAC